jgi:hypothetical protein
VAPVRPIAREIECRSGIPADKMAHLPSTPSGRSRSVANVLALSRIPVAPRIVVRDMPMLMIRPSLRRLRKQKRDRESGRQGRQLHAITPTHYAFCASSPSAKMKTPPKPNGGVEQMGWPL